ncbi:MAG TPA: ABC transporter permease subunit [Candidatus Yaniella excrementigallinarum]|nr:ABC transporter permease subunit [Candidatus Yaniella excrementigallinarum]
MEDILYLFEQYPIFEGFWTNIQLAIWASIAAFIFGVVLALFRVSPVRSLSWLSAAFINVVRNTPLTVLVVMSVLVLWGQLQINMHSNFEMNFFILATIALSVYHAPFFAEAIRSGVNTVPVGQAEAARSIGLGFFPAARLIIFPQAIRGAITPIGNTLIALIKNTTVAAAASVTEASGVMKTMIEFNPNFMIAIFLIIAIGFSLIVIPVGLLTTWLSDKLAVTR